MLFFNVVVKERFTIDDIGHGDNLLNKNWGFILATAWVISMTWEMITLELSAEFRLRQAEVWNPARPA